MKRFLIILCLILMASVCPAEEDTNPYIAGSGVAASGDYGVRADTVDTDYGTITDHADLDMLNNFCVEFFLYYDGTGDPVNYCHIVSHYPAWWVGFNGSGKISGTVNISSTPAAVNSTSTFSDLTIGYHHIAFVKSSTAGLAIYVDGSSEDTSAETGNIDTTALNVGVLRYLGDTGYGMKFRIDELRISDVVRYSGASLTVPTASFTSDANAIALYKFNAGSGSTALDETAASHDITWSGTMTLNETGKW